MKARKLLLFTIALFTLTACPPNHRNCYSFETKYDEEEHFEVCQECGKEKEGSRRKHVFQTNKNRLNENKEATCEEAGWTWQICSCGLERKVEVKAKGHDYSKVKSTTATCTDAGLNTMECSICGVESPNKIQQDAFGHDWAKAADQTGAMMPLCYVPGTEKQACMRDGCGATQIVGIDSLGHDFTDTVGPVMDGYVRLTQSYCKHQDCLRLSWDAKEVTDNCKNNVRVVDEGEKIIEEPNYVEEGDGVRFWGRPIRNACVLQENGKPESQSVAAPIYDPTVTGSFLEYKISLGNSISEVKLTTEMVQNASLENGQELYRAIGGDLTPGLIPSNNSDQYEISPFRYEIQVDSKVLDFKGWTNKKTFNDKYWFDFPTEEFDLEEGEHTIRISMAGGLTGIFYKFGIIKGESPRKYQ